MGKPHNKTRQRFRNQLPRWYETKGDWMLINKALTGFKIMVWNEYDPRPLLRNILESEVRT